MKPALGRDGRLQLLALARPVPFPGRSFSPRFGVVTHLALDGGNFRFDALSLDGKFFFRCLVGGARRRRRVDPGAKRFLDGGGLQPAGPRDESMPQRFGTTVKSSNVPRADADGTTDHGSCGGNHRDRHHLQGKLGQVGYIDRPCSEWLRNHVLRHGRHRRCEQRAGASSAASHGHLLAALHLRHCQNCQKPRHHVLPHLVDASRDRALGCRDAAFTSLPGDASAAVVETADRPRRRSETERWPRRRCDRRN